MNIDLKISHKRYVIGKFPGDFRDQQHEMHKNTQKCSRSKITVTQWY